MNEIKQNLKLYFDDKKLYDTYIQIDHQLAREMLGVIIKNTTRKMDEEDEYCVQLLDIATKKYKSKHPNAKSFSELFSKIYKSDEKIEQKSFSFWREFYRKNELYNKHALPAGELIALGTKPTPHQLEQVESPDQYLPKPNKISQNWIINTIDSIKNNNETKNILATTFFFEGKFKLFYNRNYV
jgi:hypothetical protein